MTKEKNENPFQLAAKIPKKMKVFLWGAAGTGKTTLALQFPSPVVIDLEGGTDLYGDRTEFSVLKTIDLAEIKGALAWLKAEQHSYETVIIDPITIFWEQCHTYWQKVFLARLAGAKGHKKEFFELGPREWSQIKSSYRNFLTSLIDLPLHIVCCAREKQKYKETGFMISDGNAPDCEKSTEYLFDVVLQLTTYGDREKKIYESVTTKDRSGKLPAIVETDKVAAMLLDIQE